MKYAFVTGAGRGLGKGFVDYLTTHDYFVFAGVRTVKKEYINTPQLFYIPCDVTSDASIKNAFEQISTHTDHLDLIVNNAGLNKDSATGGHKEKVSLLSSLEREYLLTLFNANAVSPLMVVKTFVPLLKKDPSFIINIASCRASFHDAFDEGNPNYGYAASKIALNMYTYRLTKELPPHIRTFAVHPGSVKTDMNPGGDQLPVDQAGHIISITDHFDQAMNGKFFNWDGTAYPL